MPADRTAFAVLGLYDSAQALVDAVPRVRAGAGPRAGTAALGRITAYTPYPVHGLDRVLGLPRSRLPIAVMTAALLGTTLALLMEWWMSAVDYPIPTGGKALFSWQAFVPIMFEVTVLFATFTAGLGMLFAFNRLPFFGHPVLASNAIRQITRDRFALSIESAGTSGLDIEACRAALLASGALSVEVLPIPDAGAPLGLAGALRIAGGIALACAVAGGAIHWVVKLYPVLPPMSHMHQQRKLMPFQASALFPDGRGMRQPPAGTVARGHLPAAFATAEEAGTLLANPLPRTRAVLEQGRSAYNTTCAVCHGAVGDGVPMLSKAYGGKPANLQSVALRGYPDGQLFGVITLGKNAMPSYAAELDEDRRWAVVHYLRALQRAQDARDEDLP